MVINFSSWFTATAAALQANTLSLRYQKFLKAMVNKLPMQFRPSKNSKCIGSMQKNRKPIFLSR
jgi:hypothetical protein